MLQCVAQSGFFKLEDIQVAKKELKCSVINFKHRLKIKEIFIFNPILQAKKDLAIGLAFI